MKGFMFRVLSFGLLFVPLVVHAQIHADFKKYHTRFVSEAAARGVELTQPAPARMQYFESADGQAITFMSDGSIYFNKTAWKAASEEKRECRVFHELGHWYLRLGHIRHRDAVMNPNTSGETYAAHRAAMLDDLFRPVYETDMNRKELTVTAGSIVVCSDAIESETMRVYVMPDDTERMAAIVDSIQRTHVQADYINPKGWRFKPYDYVGVKPVLRYGGRIAEVFGEYGGIYMYADAAKEAPRIAAQRGQWDEDTAMNLVVDYKPVAIRVRRNATILYYVRSIVAADDVKKKNKIKN